MAPAGDRGGELVLLRAAITVCVAGPRWHSARGRCAPPAPRSRLPTAAASRSPSPPWSCWPCTRPCCRRRSAPGRGRVGGVLLDRHGVDRQRDRADRGAGRGDGLRHAVGAAAPQLPPAGGGDRGAAGADPARAGRARPRRGAGRADPDRPRAARRARPLPGRAGCAARGGGGAARGAGIVEGAVEQLGAGAALPPAGRGRSRRGPRRRHRTAPRRPPAPRRARRARHRARPRPPRHLRRRWR